MSPVSVYLNGIVHCSACADATLTPTEVEAEVNRVNPSGTSLGWKIADAATFTGGEPNPCACNTDASRLHYLMVC